jgi:hypothetical protein
MLPVAAAFVLLAWLNCYAIENWERDGDSARGLGGSRVFWLGIVLAAGCGLTATAMGAMEWPRMAALLGCGAVSAGLLAGLDRGSARFSAVGLRALADLVLLVPVVVLFRI